MATQYTFGEREVRRIARSVRKTESQSERLGLDAPREVPTGRLAWFRVISDDAEAQRDGAILMVTGVDQQDGEPEIGESRTFQAGALSEVNAEDWTGIYGVAEALAHDGTNAHGRITFGSPVWIWGPPSGSEPQIGQSLGPKPDGTGQAAVGYPGFSYLGSRRKRAEEYLYLALAEAPARLLVTVRETTGDTQDVSTVELLAAGESETGLRFQAHKRFSTLTEGDQAWVERIGREWTITAPVTGEDRMYVAQADWQASNNGQSICQARELVWENNNLVASGEVFQVRQFQQFAGKAGFRGWCRKRFGLWWDVTTGCKV